MKKTILLSILFISSQLILAQKKKSKIDSISSKEGVEKLIHSFDKKYEIFKLKNINEFKNRYGMNEFCGRIADSLNITKSFYKTDFDNNGFTDLLAIGEYYEFNIFVVMNFGQDSLKLIRLLRKGFWECTFPKIINDTIIRYYYMSVPAYGEQEKPSLQQRDLAFKFGDFVEQNPNLKTYNIEKIEYQTTRCLGSCPKFNIEINKDKTALFNAVNFNRRTRDSEEVKGTFTTTLKDNAYSEIIDVLNYIDFPSLKDSYEVSWTDDQSSTLKITYNDGQKKEIKDYGLLGSFGLDRLYQLFFDLRFNQEWR